MCWRCVNVVAGVGSGGGPSRGDGADVDEAELEERRAKATVIALAVGPAAFLSLRDVAKMCAAEMEARRASYD